LKHVDFEFVYFFFSGHYALIIYEPLPQDLRHKPCANYDFNFQLGFVRTALGEGTFIFRLISTTILYTICKFPVNAMEQLYVERVCHLVSLPESLMTSGYLGEGAVPHSTHAHRTFRYLPERAHHDIHFDLQVALKV
jgi:hypothetical protein